MAVKTMTGSSTGQNPYARGWHTATINRAEEGSWNDSKYVDVYFDGYKDNFTLRVYEKHNKTTNEEFAVARLFKFANAGIISVLKDETGNKPVIQYDDDLQGLTGKQLNIFIVDDKNNNEYARIWDRFAPVTQEGDHLSYSDDDVTYWKEQAQDAHTKYGNPNVSNGAVHGEAQTTPDSTIVTDDLPF